MKINLKSKNTTVYQRTPGKTHFIDNEAFTQELEARRAKVKEALEAGKEPPPVSNSIGTKLNMIAEALSKRHYFIGYSYREDMVQTALIDCVRYIDSFNPEKGRNPFSYFNQVCAFAFIRYIQSEKKQSYVKLQVIRNLGTILEDLQIDSHDAGEDFKNYISELLMQSSNPDLDRLFAKKPAAKKEDAVPTIDDEPIGEPDGVVDEPFTDIQYDPEDEQ